MKKNQKNAKQCSEFASLIWFRQFSIPLNSPSLALFAFQWSDFNKSMTIQYTFCIKIFVLLSCYSGFMLPRSLSDVYNNRLCYVFFLKTFSYLPNRYMPSRSVGAATIATRRTYSGRVSVLSFTWRWKKWKSVEEIVMRRKHFSTSKRKAQRKKLCRPLRIRTLKKKLRPRIAANKIVQFSINVINSSTVQAKKLPN